MSAVLPVRARRKKTRVPPTLLLKTAATHTAPPNRQPGQRLQPGQWPHHLPSPHTATHLAMPKPNTRRACEAPALPPRAPATTRPRRPRASSEDGPLLYRKPARLLAHLAHETGAHLAGLLGVWGYRGALLIRNRFPLGPWGAWRACLGFGV